MSLCIRQVVLSLLIPSLTTVLPLQAQDTNAAEPPVIPISAPEKPSPAECQQRIAEDFVPMTRSERLVYAVHRTVGPSSFFISAVRASINQGLRRPVEWDQGIEGFGKRFGSSYAQHFIETALENGVAYGLHEDNRYFASGRQGTWERLVYAGESAVFARRDDGSRSLSVSLLGGLAGAAFLSRTWQPRSTNAARDAEVSFGLSLAVHSAINVVREFSPPVLRRIVP